MELVKLPVPVPSAVLLSVMEGFWLVLQQTPRTVIGAPPSLMMFPPELAEVDVTEVNVVVVKRGKAAVVVVVTWFP